ncbi:ferric reductase-like protein like transmembrane component [Glonium stellatum]|uniref:ferric-chelate reductase (NADPH) n=1 Tax=Glonium stellatum TaxID=574774 RepID=A0A8E2FB88_9PEZI|nr:ferric reductase-like protein like transmembrane component [Glonium stellatum]
MDMSGMGMPMPSPDNPSGPLTTAGLDMTNSTVQANYLASLLDDTELQVTSNLYATRFWYGIVVVIGIAAIFNIVLRLLLYTRLKNAASGKPNITNFFKRTVTVVTTAFRKTSYPQIFFSHHTGLGRLPPFGIIIMVLAYIAYLFALEYINVQIPGDQNKQAISVRAGWLTITQVPLLVLLAGKVNLIGFFTGVSYERLNILHRWVARGMLITATMHFVYQNVLWSDRGLLQLEWNTDTCPPSGIAAYSFILWMNITTIAPIRNWWYEFFVIQHLITWFGFVVAIMYHLPSTALYSRVYIWISIGLYCLDRLLRSLRSIYNNIRPGRATLMKMPGGVTKIVVRSRQVKHWAPGSFVLLSLPRFGVGQSHPATIASVPSSHGGDLVFILRAHQGFTTRILAGASESIESKATYLAFIDGPYGGTHLDFAAFSTVILIAGSTGVTFTLSLLLDLAARAPTKKLLLQEIVFIWAIKKKSCYSWISSELQQAMDILHVAGIRCSTGIFITDDKKLVGSDSNLEQKQLASSGSIHEKCSPEGSQSPASNEQDSRFRTGRPDTHSILFDAQSRADGEMGVAVCGPMGLSTSVRMQVTSLISKTKPGIYLHAESFGW